jgi:hypothetical protein
MKNYVLLKTLYPAAASSWQRLLVQSPQLLTSLPAPAANVIYTVIAG